MPQAIALAIPAIVTALGTAGATTAGAGAVAGATGLTAGTAAGLGTAAATAGTLAEGLAPLFQDATQALGLPKGLQQTTSSTASNNNPFVAGIPGNSPGTGLSPTSGFGGGGAPTGQAAVQQAMQSYGASPQQDPYGAGFENS
jgi:hypothetical protein